MKIMFLFILVMPMIAFHFVKLLVFYYCIFDTKIKVAYIVIKTEVFVLLKQSPLDQKEEKYMKVTEMPFSENFRFLKIKKGIWIF